MFWFLTVQYSFLKNKNSQYQILVKVSVISFNSVVRIYTVYINKTKKVNSVTLGLVKRPSLANQKYITEDIEMN